MIAVHAFNLCIAIYVIDLHNLDDRSWENETSNDISASSQSTSSHINSLIENNSKLTSNIADLVEQVTTLQKTIAAKDKILHQQQSEILALKKQLGDQSKSKSSKKVDPALSQLIRDMYPKLDQSEKFDVSIPYDSEKNKEVCEQLQSMLQVETESKFDKQSLDIAIKARYYNQKKLAKESSEAATQRRRVSRRHTKYRARTKIAVEHSLHQSLMKELTTDDMSDEISIDGDEKRIKVKKPKWRSSDVNQKLKELDAKSEESCKALRKTRVIGSPSTRTSKLHA